MAQILIPDLDDDTVLQLRQRAKRNGRSMSAEVIEILREAMRRKPKPARGLGSEIVAMRSDRGIGLKKNE